MVTPSTSAAIHSVQVSMRVSSTLSASAADAGRHPEGEQIGIAPRRTSGCSRNTQSTPATVNAGTSVISSVSAVKLRTQRRAKHVECVSARGQIDHQQQCWRDRDQRQQRKDSVGDVRFKFDVIQSVRRARLNPLARARRRPQTPAAHAQTRVAPLPPAGMPANAVQPHLL